MFANAVAGIFSSRNKSTECKNKMFMHVLKEKLVCRCV